MYKKDILVKSKLLDFIRLQFPVILIMISFSLILTYKNYSPLNTVFSIAILYFFSYICHYFAHYKPKAWFNFHMRFHHNKDKNISNKQFVLNWFAEVVSNIFMFLVVFMVIKYIIEYLFKIEFVPLILIVYYGIIYVTCHNINYSLYHLSKSHLIHHETASNIRAYNYGPDIFDHIFGSNYNNKLENIWHLIPNIFISFLITYILFNPNNLVSFRFLFYLIILHAINLLIFSYFKIKNKK
jgi:hypothetical protein